MNAVKVGNVILMKDKVISVTLKRQGIVVTTITGEAVLCYNSQDEAQRAFDEFYRQL